RLRPTRSLPLRRPTLSTGRLPLTGHAARLLSPCLTRSLALVRRSLSGRLTLTRRAARVRGTRLGRRLPLARRRGGARRLALTGGLAVVRRPNLRTRRPGRAGRTARLHSTRLGRGLALARRCSGARRLALASGLALARRRCDLAWGRGPGAGLVWRVRLSAGRLGLGGRAGRVRRSCLRCGPAVRRRAGGRWLGPGGGRGPALARPARRVRGSRLRR